MIARHGSARWSFELLMTLIRTGKAAAAEPGRAALVRRPGCAISADVPAALPQAPDLEQTIRDWHGAGHSQRAIARELNIDRRKVKRAVTSGLTWRERWGAVPGKRRSRAAPLVQAAGLVADGARLEAGRQPGFAAS
jgi:hypothetical protein